MTQKTLAEEHQKQKRTAQLAEDTANPSAKWGEGGGGPGKGEADGSEGGAGGVSGGDKKANAAAGDAAAGNAGAGDGAPGDAASPDGDKETDHDEVVPSYLESGGPDPPSPLDSNVNLFQHSAPFRELYDLSLISKTWKGRAAELAVKAVSVAEQVVSEFLGRLFSRNSHDYTS